MIPFGPPLDFYALRRLAEGLLVSAFGTLSVRPKEGSVALGPLPDMAMHTIVVGRLRFSLHFGP